MLLQHSPACLPREDLPKRINNTKFCFLINYYFSCLLLNKSSACICLCKRTYGTLQIIVKPPPFVNVCWNSITNFLYIILYKGGCTYNFRFIFIISFYFKNILLHSYGFTRYLGFFILTAYTYWIRSFLLVVFIWGHETKRNTCLLNILKFSLRFLFMFH